MKHPERNDVDISALFKWSKEIVVSDDLTGQKIQLYLRLVGDSDLGRARAYALRKAGTLRQALREPNSDLRISYISETKDFKDKATLAQACILLMSDSVQKQAIDNMEAKEPKAPKSTATQEEFEKYQTSLDGWNDKFMSTLSKEVEKVAKRIDKELLEKTEEELYSLYESLVIDRLCTGEMNTSFYSMCGYYSTFTDPEFRRRAFRSFEEFDNVSPQLKKRVLEEYQRLELGMDILKKSPGATELPQPGQPIET